jgi:hypothetical protein
MKLGALGNRKGEHRWKETESETKGLCEDKQGGTKRKYKKSTECVKLP